MKTYLVWVRFFFYIVTLGHAESSLGLPGISLPCVSAVHKTSVAQWQDMVHTVSLVGTAKNQFAFSEYQTMHHLSDEQMFQQFSGNGEFHCGWKIGSASFLFS